MQHDLVSSLPAVDPDSARHSARVADALRQHIDAAGGQISFADYMQFVLYEPGLGYYSGGLQKFGESGDFITAPEVSPLFSQCLARQLAQILAKIDHPDVVEFGAGSGVMAADILLELERLQALPARYCIIELSAELRERQQRRIAEMARLSDCKTETPILAYSR